MRFSPVFRGLHHVAVKLLFVEASGFALIRHAALLHNIGSATEPQLQGALHLFALLRLTADFSTCFACTLICCVLANMAWGMRGKVPFRTTSLLLGVLLLGFGVRRVLDYTPVSLAYDLHHMEQVLFRTISSVLISACLLLLVPIFRAMADVTDGRSAEERKRIEAVYDTVQLSANRLRQELADGIERGELQVHFQPQFSCRGGQLLGAEALVRWNHPTRGLLPPAEFIGLAEETGLIIPLGDWVIKSGCAQIAQLNRRLGLDLKLAVNLSAHQFRQQTLAATIRQALTSSALAPTCLQLEITESVLLESTAETRHQLDGLRELGVTLAIDDFGTGYSNFRYILDYDVDCLKIDRSFVAKCPHDPHAAAIVRAIIAMAHGLDLRVVAEGVENASHLAFLTRRHCDEAQGYYWSPALPMNRFEEFVLQRSERMVPPVAAMPLLVTALQ